MKHRRRVEHEDDEDFFDRPLKGEEFDQVQRENRTS